MRWLCVALVFLAACSSITSPTASNSPATSTTSTSSRVTYPGSSPSPGRYAVMQRGIGTLDLIDETRGQLAVATQVDQPRSARRGVIPWTSMSSSRVFYLNSSSEVWFLAPDGSTGQITTIPVAADEQAGFAVSPDEQRIAVAIFKYPDATTYGGMRMYVEDLRGGGHHFDIFSSATAAEFPIGWVGANLVVAVSVPSCCPNLALNPYIASEYHVVDPQTGRRLETICAGAPPRGPVVAAGAMCLPPEGGAPSFVRWDGSAFSSPGAIPDAGQFLEALSPDGTHVLVGGSPIRVFGAGSDFRFDMNGWAIGWIDATHVIVRNAQDDGYFLMDPRSGQGVELSAETGFLGTLPVAIS